MAKKKMREVKIAIDRGNGSTKVVCSVDGAPIEVFKFPSVIRKVDPNSFTVNIGKDSYLVGKEAIVSKEGFAETPLTKDKITGLHFVVAQALHQVLGSSCTISLDIGVASPHNNPVAEAAISKELKSLEKGFKVGDAEYQLENERIKRVKCDSEAAGILRTNSNQFNGVIDCGFGTMITYYLDFDGSIQTGSFIDGECGGVNLSISELRSRPVFIEAMRKVKAPTLPSSEMIGSVLAKGDGYQFRGLDLLQLLKPCIGSLVTRINAACEATKSSFLSRHGYDVTIPFKPVLIGGGAALLKAVIESEAEVVSKPVIDPKTGEEKPAPKRKALVNLHPDLTIFEPTPDFQTSLIIHQDLVTSPITETVVKESKVRKLKKNQSEEAINDRQEETLSGDQSSKDQVHSISAEQGLVSVP